MSADRDAEYDREIANIGWWSIRRRDYVGRITHYELCNISCYYNISQYMPQVFCNNFRVNCNTINRATEKFKVVCDGGQLYRIQRTTHSYTASCGICTVLPSTTQTSNYYRPLQRLWQSMNLIDYCGKNQGLLMHGLALAWLSPGRGFCV